MSDEDPRARLESLEREIEHLRRENQRLLDVQQGHSSVLDGSITREATERERRRVERLQSFTVKLSAARTIRDVIGTIVAEGCVMFAAARGVFAKVEAPQGALEIVRMDGFSEESRATWLGRRLPLAEALPITDAVRTDTPICIGDSPSIDARYPSLKRMRSRGTQALLALPIRAGSSQLGALALEYTSPTHFTEDDRREMQTFARLAGQALERSQLLDTAKAEMRRAEEASRAKDLFLGMMSHELRTPLTAILGWATILRGRLPPPDKLAKALQVIERNARAQAQLIDDLLDVTKILAGSMRIEAQDVDPMVVVEAAIEAVLPTAAAKGVDIVRALDAGARKLHADPARLQQVVWNLLSNAVKFTPAGGQVFVSLLDDEGDVELAVEDTGKGIAPEFLPHLFEPFRQADVGTTRAHGGLGLGLAIVRHLVDLHGGTIDATSRGEGKGARFVVRLPRARDSEVVASDGSGLSWAGPAPGPILEGRRILVIDDEPDVLEMLEAYLSSRGATVFVAGGAAEGLEKIKESRPDVIVCDIGMPDQDGYSFIEELRKFPPAEGGATPVVALTAYARPEDRRRALLHGFDTHVAKPLDPSELAAVVARLSTSKAAARSRAS